MIKNEFLLLFCLHLVFFNLLSRHGYMSGGEPHILQHRTVRKTI